MLPTAPIALLLALFGLAACAESVPSVTPNPTTAQKVRDALDPARGPTEATGRAIDRATNPTRPEQSAEQSPMPLELNEVLWTSFNAEESASAPTSCAGGCPRET